MLLLCGFFSSFFPRFFKTNAFAKVSLQAYTQWRIATAGVVVAVGSRGRTGPTRPFQLKETAAPRTAASKFFRLILGCIGCAGGIATTNAVYFLGVVSAVDAIVGWRRCG